MQLAHGKILHFVIHCILESSLIAFSSLVVLKFKCALWLHSECDVWICAYIHVGLATFNHRRLKYLLMTTLHKVRYNDMWGKFMVFSKCNQQCSTTSKLFKLLIFAILQKVYARNSCLVLKNCQYRSWNWLYFFVPTINVYIKASGRIFMA